MSWRSETDQHASDSVPFSAVEVGDEIIGVTAAKAARIAGITLHQLAGWERNGLVAPRLHAKLSGHHLRLYDLPSLVELRVIAELRRRGISVKRIQRIVGIYQAIAAGRPLAMFRWGVDGNKVYVQAPDGSWWDGRKPRQGVMVETFDLDEVRADVRRRARERELGIDGARIEKRTRTMGGKELLAGTRTPVAAVEAYIRRGLPDTEILEAFPHLDVEDIEAVRRAHTA